MRALGLARAALATLLVASPLAANPVDGFGIGSRSTAMAGAVSASVRDFSANYYNPSGLALARGTDLSLGYVYVAQRLEMNGHDSEVDPVSAIVGGIVAPGSVLTIPFAFGLAVHLPDDRLSRARSMKAEDPRWVLWDNRPQLLYLSANLAIRPLEWLAIGGGVSFLAATRGSFEITGNAVLPVGERTEYDSQLRHEVDADLTSVRYPTFGITVTPTDWLDFGLVYRDEAEIELDIAAQLDGTIDASLLRVPAHYELASTTTNAFIPRQIVLGTALTPSKQLRIGLDLTFVNWAAYESPTSRTRSELDVDAPSNLPLDLPPNPQPTTKLDPGFSNRIVPRLGVEYGLRLRRRFELPLRAGYAYERSPVPPQTARTSFVDADRHLLSVGAGILWSEPGRLLPGNLRFDTHVTWAILPERVTHKDNPADYVGDFRAGGHQLGVGATLSVGFL